MDDTLVLIPAYQPNDELVELAGSLYAVGFRIIVVDDGSGDAYSEIFDKAAAYATVIGYEKNRGKGNALKYGLDFVKEQMSYFKYLVLVDADGQHSVDAVVALSDVIHQKGGIVIGERSSKELSFAGRICNKVLHTMYSLLTGIYISDVLSGLRAFEIKYLSWLQEVEGDTFEYEMNVLLGAAKRRYPIHTTAIAGVNSWQQRILQKNSHYRPVRDLFLQFKTLVKTGWPSITAMLINYAVMCIAVGIFGTGFAGIAGAVILGSLFGICATVYLNNRIGFEENVDGVLSYNRIMMGLLRFNAYLLVLELLGALMGIGFFLSLVITVVFVTYIECSLMKYGVDNNVRLKNV